MTIAITLNNVQSYSTSQPRGNSSNHTNIHTTMREQRPYRKVQQQQQYHHHHHHHHHQSQIMDQHRLPRNQILPNGYSVVPMLSLRDATIMHHQQQQQQRQQQRLLQTNYEYHPKYVPSTHVLDETKFDTKRNYIMMDNSSTSMSSSSLSSSMMNKQKKCVRFAPTATIKLRSITDDELFHSWYNTRNYISFEEENRQIISSIYDASSTKDQDMSTATNQISNDAVPSDEVHTADTQDMQYQTLGLEQYLLGPKHMMERRQAMMQHSAMVLEIYDVQRCVRQYNPDIVRRVSQRLSKPIIERAIHRAKIISEL